MSQHRSSLCLDLNKLCYDFTCVHSGVCSANDNDGPRCDCLETAYVGERCDKRKQGPCVTTEHEMSASPSLSLSSRLVPNGFYFGKHHGSGLVEYVMPQTRQTEYDTIAFGLQTLSMSAQVFRLESDMSSYSLEYEIVSSLAQFSPGDRLRVVSAARPILHQTEHGRQAARRLLECRPRHGRNVSCDQSHSSTFHDGVVCRWHPSEVGRRK